jgi:hypothetical protein
MEYRQKLAADQAADVKMMQKVNHTLRDAFVAKYPGQVEHCLRLVMERLQAGLDKRDNVDVAKPETWRMSTVELQELAHTAYLLNEIRSTFPTAGE